MKPTLLFLLVAAAAAALAQGITHRNPPSVSLDGPTKRKLVEKALTLRAGDSFQTATNTLGTPTTNTNYGGDFHYLDYHMQAWQRERVDDSREAEYVRVRVDQSNRVVSVWIRVESK